MMARIQRVNGELPLIVTRRLPLANVNRDGRR